MAEQSSNTTQKVLIWLGVATAVVLVVVVAKKALRKAGVSFAPANNLLNGSNSFTRMDNNWDDMGGYYLKYYDKTEQYFDSAGNFKGMRQYNQTGGYMGPWIDVSVLN